jgi:hypothetical protein
MPILQFRDELQPLREGALTTEEEKSADDIAIRTSGNVGGKKCVWYD